VAHPNALPLFATRAAVTEAALAHVEEALGVLHQAGFDRGEALTAFQLVVTFVVGHTLNAYGPQRADERSDPRYAALDPKRFPHVRAMGAGLAKHDARSELELGVDLLLDGAEERFSNRRKRRR
jgi:hypothetical protein